MSFPLDLLDSCWSNFAIYISYLNLVLMGSPGSGNLARHSNLGPPVCLNQLAVVTFSLSNVNNKLSVPV